MIMTQHNDGMCFKITIEETDYDEYNRKIIMYADSFDEAFDWAVEEINKISENNLYVMELRIQDDSK